VTARPTDAATADELLRLERALAERDGAFGPDGLAALLDDGFLEFGASGGVWDRDSIVAMLLKSAPIEAVEIGAFAARHVADGVVLVTYRLADSRNGVRRLSRRSSIWLASPAGWRVVFHQGTPIPDDATR
jgi:hypothetical protein